MEEFNVHGIHARMGDIAQDRLAMLKTSNDQLVSVEKFGQTGLFNMGNTCFFNASVQILAHTVKLRNYLLSNKFKEKVNDVIKADLIKQGIISQPKEGDNSTSIDSKMIEHEGSKYMSYCFANLFDSMWKTFPSLRPVSLYTLFKKKHPMFGMNGQEDANECIMPMLDDFHMEICEKANVIFPEISEDVKQLVLIRDEYVRTLKDKSSTKKEIETSKNNYDKYKKDHVNAKVTYESFKYWQKHIKTSKFSKVTDLFDGLLNRTVECDECKNVSYSFTPYRHLPVPIPIGQSSTRNVQITLDDCLKQYCCPETLSGEDQYKCEICNKKVNSVTNTKLWEISDTLSIQFVRFHKTQMVGRNMISQKNNIRISYPLKLNIFEYLSDISKLNKQSKIEDCNYELYGVICHSGTQGGNQGGGHYYALCKNSFDNLWYCYNDSSVNKISVDQATNDDNAYILYYDYIGKKS